MHPDEDDLASLQPDPLRAPLHLQQGIDLRLFDAIGQRINRQNPRLRYIFGVVQQSDFDNNSILMPFIFGVRNQHTLIQPELIERKAD